MTYGADPLDVVRDVLRTLAAAPRGAAAGIPAERILVDPTLDFGKTTPTRSRCCATPRTSRARLPVLQALSRKDFVGERLGLEADDRLEGTLAATAVAAWLGATVFRAHDVRATRRVVDMVADVRGDRTPVRAVRGVARAGPAPQRTEVVPSFGRTAARARSAGGSARFLPVACSSSLVEEVGPLAEIVAGLTCLGGGAVPPRARRQPDVGEVRTSSGQKERVTPWLRAP